MTEASEVLRCREEELNHRDSIAFTEKPDFFSFVVFTFLPQRSTN